MAEKEITIEIKNLEIICLAIFSIIILFLELQVMYSTPISFGDEGYHTRLSQLMAENVEYPIYTTFMATNLAKYGFFRLPLWNILEASVFLISQYSDVLVRFLTPLIAITIGIGSYVLIKRLYNEKIALIGSILLMTIPSFVTYSVLLYTDVLMTLYLTLFFLVFLIALKNGSRKYLFLAGIFGALAFLAKTPGIAAYLFVIIILLYELIRNRKIIPIIKKYGPMIVIMLIIPSTFFIRSLYYYKTPACFLPLPFFSTSSCTVDNFKPKFEWSGRVAQTGTEQGVLSMGITNFLSFAYGNIPYPTIDGYIYGLPIVSWGIVILGFLGGLAIFLLRRHKIDLAILSIFITLLIVVIEGNILTRAEDTARYILGWAPVIALIAGVYFGELYDFIKKYQKYVALVIFILVFYFSFVGLKEKVDGMSQVKQFSPLFFEACNWIKQNTPKDAMLSTVWAYRAAYNCQRTSVGNYPDIVMSTDINYTLSVTKQLGITYLFIQKFSIDTQNQHLSENYDLSFVQFLENNSAHFINVYENGPPLDQCIQAGGCDGNILYEIKY